MSDTTPGPVRVLIVDDDRKMCRLVRDYLEPMGFEVAAAFSGTDGLEQALTGEHDVVILDVMLPGMDGLEVLRRLREQSTIPVLMLTSRGDETDRIVGLEVGADDYLPKTFSSRELLARLRAVTRRSMRFEKAEPASEELVFTDLRVNLASRTARLGDEPLDLTPVEFGLLARLARSAGRVLSRDQLLDDVLGRDYESFDRSVDVHISSLRRKLRDDPKAPRFIKTVRSAGYLFLGGTPERDA
ncbi:MAG: response regulator transcription factor [Deltaproteobacteria bacterium]|nr:response regulator transcription factor [Deltaproteobacteria bacterium]